MIPKRVVLDTNICLDLFVFRDPRWTALLEALRQGRLRAVTRSDCREEWLHVLGYRHLPLDAESRESAVREFDALIACVDKSAPEAAQTGSAHAARLPVCSDPDDQKFLEAARDTEAELLITKDKALLKLARKTAKSGLFGIIPPEKWQPESAGADPAT